jgi:enamine deaminase RidA (YjgF/YER057c/UK114 family)
MGHHTINPPDLPAPTGFSHGVAAGQGRTVYLAGQNGTDASGRIPSGAGLVQQMDLALANLLRVVRSAGGTAGDVVQLTLYVTDVADYRATRTELGQIWKQHFGRYYPAMALVGVAALYDTDAVVEIDGVAVVVADTLAAP